MARTGFFHHIGTFLLLSATVLLIVTCISAPVVHDIALLHVDFGTTSRSSLFDSPSIAFGTFGWCENHNNAADECTSSRLGYSPYTAITWSMGSNGNGNGNGNIDDSNDNLGGIDDDGYLVITSDGDRAAAVTTRRLTKAMILHPIACGLNFIAFMLALGAGFVGSFLASLVALLAFLTTAVIMIIDFVMFSIVRAHVDDWTGGSDNSGTVTGNGLIITSHYGAAAWTILASAICSLLGTIVVFFTCCSGRLHKRREARRGAGPKTDYGEPVVGTTGRRRRFGIF